MPDCALAHPRPILFMKGSETIWNVTPKVFAVILSQALMRSLPPPLPFFC
jgi:hypothetical protein